LNRLAQTALQEFLDRGGVGQEILGAEPLAMLIREEVIRGLGLEPETALFSAFAEKGIQFLATTTNLTQSRHEILGLPENQDQTSILYGLLASSAFPAVFRPRQKWEIFRQATETDQYVDGGLIDNLPLDAVASFLDRASSGSKPPVARRPVVQGPAVPHLLFTASLEVDKIALGEGHLEEYSRSFRRLQERAKTFGYNRKIDAYRALQEDLRTIYRHEARRGHTPAWTPVDLHVIAVRPRWLCSTFGFHPMLKFRRRKQAQSIAHGCAATIATFYHEAQREGAAPWMEAWGVRGLEEIHKDAVTCRSNPREIGFNPRSKRQADGLCWFRDAPCPFSAKALGGGDGENQGRKLQEGEGAGELSGRPNLLRELPKIHQLCGLPETHQPRHAVR